MSTDMVVDFLIQADDFFFFAFNSQNLHERLDRDALDWKTQNVCSENVEIRFKRFV